MEKTVALEVADNGRIEIKTKLKELPIEVVQRLLDEAIAVIIQTYIPDEQKHLIIDNFMAAKMWKTIAFTQLIVTIILMIIFKVGR